VALHFGASRSSREAADHWVPALCRGPTAKYRSAGLTRINPGEQLPLRREAYRSLDVADEIADRHYPVEIVIRDLHSGELFDRYHQVNTIDPERLVGNGERPRHL
jgi:hypothetical protein